MGYTDCFDPTRVKIYQPKNCANIIIFEREKDTYLSLSPEGFDCVGEYEVKEKFRWRDVDPNLEIGRKAPRGPMECLISLIEIYAEYTAKELYEGKFKDDRKEDYIKEIWRADGSEDRNRFSQ